MIVTSIVNIELDAYLFIKDSTGLWKDINELYQISNFGEVRRTKTKKIIALKNHKSRNSVYKICSMSLKGERKQVYIHRILAEVFMLKMKGKDLVKHKDGNTLNNSLANLYWV